MTRTTSNWLILFVLCLSVMVVGCKEPTGGAGGQQAAAPPPVEDDEKPVNIIGKKTQEIGEYDPATDEEADLQVKEDANPISAQLGGLQYAIGTTAKLKIEMDLKLFHATNGRYPKDHQEFMDEVIKANNTQLPMLPHSKEYKYDVENHKLVVVEKQK